MIIHYKLENRRYINLISTELRIKRTCGYLSDTPLCKLRTI